jgi:hypothetical protein
MDKAKGTGRFAGFDPGVVDRSRPERLDDEAGVLVLCKYRLLTRWGEPVIGWKMVHTCSAEALPLDFDMAVKEAIRYEYLPRAMKIDLLAYIPAPGTTLL